MLDYLLVALESKRSVHVWLSSLYAEIIDDTDRGRAESSTVVYLLHAGDHIFQLLSQLLDSVLQNMVYTADLNTNPVTTTVIQTVRHS